MSAFDSEAGKDILKDLVKYRHNLRRGKDGVDSLKARDELLNKARKASRPRSGDEDFQNETPSGQHGRRGSSSEALAPNTLEAGTIALLEATGYPGVAPANGLFDRKRSSGLCFGANVILPYRANGKNLDDAPEVTREKDERKRLKKICEARKAPDVDCNRVPLNHVQDAPPAGGHCVNAMADEVAQEICALAPKRAAPEQVAQKIARSEAAAQSTAAKKALAPDHSQEFARTKELLNEDKDFLKNIGAQMIEGKATAKKEINKFFGGFRASADEKNKETAPATPPAPPTDEEKIAAGESILNGEIGKASIDPNIQKMLDRGLSAEQVAATIALGAKDREGAQDMATRFGLQNSGFEEKDIDAILNHPYVQQSKRNLPLYEEALQEVAFKHRMTLENAKRKQPLGKQEIHKLYSQVYLNAKQQGRDAEQAVFEALVQRDMPPVFASQLMNNRPALDSIWSEHVQRDLRIKELRAQASITKDNALWEEAKKLAAEDRNALKQGTKQAMLASVVGVSDPRWVTELDPNNRNSRVTEDDIRSNHKEQIPAGTSAVQNELAIQITRLMNLEGASKAEQREAGMEVYMALEVIKNSATTLRANTESGNYRVRQLDGSYRSMSGQELRAQLGQHIQNAKRIQEYMLSMGQAPTSHKVSHDVPLAVKDGAMIVKDGAIKAYKATKDAILSSPKKPKKERRYDNIGETSPDD